MGYGPFLRSTTEAAAVTTTIATVAAEGRTLAAFTAKATFRTVATLTVVTLLHLDRGAICMGVNLDRQHAHDVVMQAHQAFHFLHSRCRSIGFQQGIVAFAVLVDLVGHRLDAPVFAFDDLAAVVCDNCG